MRRRGSSCGRWLQWAAATALIVGGCHANCETGSVTPIGPATAQFTGPYATEPAGSALPPPLNPVPVATPVIYWAWQHPNLAAGEQVTFTLTAMNVGSAAPPNTAVGSTQWTAPAAGANHGTSNFSAPTAGWPPGQYRATIAGSGVGQFGSMDFTIQ